MIRRLAPLFILLLTLGACAPKADPAADAAAAKAEAQAFLDQWTNTWLTLVTASNEAEWKANTEIREGDTSIADAAKAAKEALAAHVGAVATIDQAKALLAKRDLLDPLQVRQLENILYRAADSPQTVPELVTRRIAAEVEQTQKLFGHRFTLAGKELSANDIDRQLRESTKLSERLAVWESSKEVGGVLKDGLANLRDLRNQTVQALGYDDYFAYQVSDYGMSVDEMVELNRQLVRDIWPLYRELHTWARYELAKQFGEEVPDMLPAHWLPNRWGQDWSSMVEVEGIDLDGALAAHDPEWVVKQAEDFYVSLGFDPMPASFWEKSSLYPLPAGTDYTKNSHASAWHIDLDQDVRSLMSVEPNTEWWSTTHHELGHVYYFMAYSRPEVPPVLREGANRAFHEAVGSQLGIASMQQAFLAGRGLAPADATVDQVQALLKEALDSVVFIPWSAGTMTHFEHDLYRTGMSLDECNSVWWKHVTTFQGIVPPGERSTSLCDAATKTHINDDAAQYYDYALSYAILHQLHDHVATKILGQDPRNTNYYGSKETGAFLGSILQLGATQPWREVMREKLGADVSAAAMLAYFAPLQGWLAEQNAGRTATLPANPPF